MKSATKSEISDELIATIVKKQFGSDATIQNCVELNDGWFNSAFALTLQSPNKKVVLKISPAYFAPVYTYEAMAMEIEVETYRLIKESTTIPIPNIFGVNFNCDIIPQKYFFMDYLDGQPWNKIKKKLPAEVTAKIKQELASHHLQLNSISNSYFGSLDLQKYMTSGNANYVKLHKGIQEHKWSVAYRKMFENLLTDFPRLGVKPCPGCEKILGLFDTAGAYLDDLKTPHLIHWDLWEGNIFIRNDFLQNPEKPYIIGLIDCERSYWGDPLSEFLFSRKPKEIEWIIQKYQSKFGDDFFTSKSAQIRRGFYDLYMYTIWYFESFTRQYPKLFSLGMRLVAKSSLNKTVKKIENLVK